MISLLCLWVITKIPLPKELLKYAFPIFIIEYIVCLTLDISIVVRLWR